MNGKRVQSNMGAKNHGVIMPDANKVFFSFSVVFKPYVLCCEYGLM